MLQINIFVSFDVVSLFTNILLDETLDIAVDYLTKDKNCNLSKTELKQLLTFATSQTHFMFKNVFYDQIDGAAMGSPLSPILANLFLGHYEMVWLNEFVGNGPIFYKRYVDDIITLFNNEEETLHFLDYINSNHKNIKFTIEKENTNKQITFLDLLVDNSVLT